MVAWFSIADANINIAGVLVRIAGELTLLAGASKVQKLDLRLVNPPQMPSYQTGCCADHEDAMCNSMACQALCGSRHHLARLLLSGHSALVSALCLAIIT